MVYPIIVLVIAIVILGFLLVFIVPKFKQIFADMLGGKALPPLTQFVIFASETVQHNILAIVGIIIVLVVGYRLLARTERGGRFLDTIKLRAPLFGDLTRKKRDLAVHPNARHAGDERCSDSSSAQHHQGNRGQRDHRRPPS